MSQNGKLMPNLDQQSTKILNLTVLQRIDPFVEEILITSAHVTFYQFNVDLNQWSRKDVEGSLFVVKRNTQPRFQFIVMNRRNTENLVENLLGDFEYEVQKPYLLYRNASQEVNGIWFYNPRECEEVANLFSRILNAYAKVPTKSKLPSGKGEFEELEAVPSMSVMDGPLESSSATTSNVTDVPEDFVNFFAAGMALGNATSSISIPLTHPPSPLPGVPTAPLSSAAPNVFKSLLDNIETSHLSRTTTANLVKPSFFSPPSSSPLMVPPVSPSVPTAPPLDPSSNLQRPYGTPLLQPFPPPTPSPSLTPIAASTLNYGPVISRDKVREALLILVQDNQFIDMVHQALLNAHNQ